MPYQLLALFAALILAIIVLLVKYISKHVLEDFGSLFYWTYTSTLPFILIIPFVHTINTSGEVILPMIINALLLTSGQLLFSKAIYLVDASTVGPLFQLQSSFILILSSIFLDEVFPTTTYIYLFLLVTGALFVSISDKTDFKKFFQIGVFYIIGMQLLHAGANIAVGFAQKHTDSLNTLFYSFLFSTGIVNSYAFITKTKVTMDFSKVKWMIARAVLLLTSTLLLYTAFKTNVSISSAIGLLSSPIIYITSVLLAIFSPKLLEKNSLRTYVIRGLGMVMILFATYNIISIE